MSNASDVTKRYWGSNVQNPIFKAVIDELISSGLYSEYLTDPTEEAIPYVMVYNNGNGDSNSAVALDVIIDCITRVILRNLQSGFNNGLNDAGSNISYSGKTNLSVNLKLCDNVTQAIDLIGLELTAIKAALQSVTGGSFQSTAILQPLPNTNKINIK